MLWKTSKIVQPPTIVAAVAQDAAAVPDLFVVKVRTDRLLACIWASVAVLMLSVGFFDVSPLNLGAARHADAVSQMIGAGGPFP